MLPAVLLHQKPKTQWWCKFVFRYEFVFFFHKKLRTKLPLRFCLTKNKFVISEKRIRDENSKKSGSTTLGTFCVVSMMRQWRFAHSGQQVRSTRTPMWFGPIAWTAQCVTDGRNSILSRRRRQKNQETTEVSEREGQLGLAINSSKKEVLLLQKKKHQRCSKVTSILRRTVVRDHQLLLQCSYY